VLVEITRCPCELAIWTEFLWLIALVSVAFVFCVILVGGCGFVRYTSDDLNSLCELQGEVGVIYSSRPVPTGCS
jgi:hypothetical protein